MIVPSMREDLRGLIAELRPFVAARVAADEVDDLLQEMLVRIVRAPLEDEARFGPWVYRVARNAIADHHRRRRARRDLPVGGEVGEDQAADDGDARADDAEDALRACLGRYVASRLAELPSPYREALERVELGGESQVDAAAALGISITAMKSRVQRGRAKLAAIVRGECRVELDARGLPIDCAPRASAGCRCD